jgi:hypothetical protein
LNESIYIISSTSTCNAVIQVLVAPFLFVFNFRLPALPFQQFPNSENRIFKMVIAVDAVLILNQVAVLDVSPPFK